MSAVQEHPGNRQIGYRRPLIFLIVSHVLVVLANIVMIDVRFGLDSGALAILLSSLIIRCLLWVVTFIGVLIAGRKYQGVGRFFLYLDAIGGTLFGIVPLLRSIDSTGEWMLLTGIVGFFSFFILWFSIGALIFARGGLTAAGAVRGVPLHSELQQRGYDWLTMEDAQQLWKIYGEAAFKLPPWPDVGVLPGVAEGDLQSLRRILELRQSPGAM